MKVFEPLDAGAFMKVLLTKDVFDRFVLIEADVTAKFRFEFDGRIDKEFYPDLDEKFIPYSSLRPVLCELIKGEKPPRMFKLVLGLSQADLRAYIEKYTETDKTYPTGLYINLRYENQELTIVSGCSVSGFDIEKSIDKAWDLSLYKFLDSKKLIK